MFNRFAGRVNGVAGKWEVRVDGPKKCIHENLQKQLTPSPNEWIKRMNE